MPIDSNEIYFVYSGSGTNANPSLSLGGEPGEIITTNAIFDNVSAIEGEEGLTDYRCCYLVNDSPDSKLNNFSVTATKDDPTLGASDVQISIGFLFREEIQVLTIIDYGSITSAIIGITYTHAVFPAKSFTITISGGIDSGVISDIKNQIYSNLMSLEGYAVETDIVDEIDGSDLLLKIKFSGFSKNKSHNLLTVTTAPTDFATISKTVIGSPINTVPDQIANELLAPAGVTFSNSGPIIGDLEPGDVVPIWLKRKIPAGSRAVTKDGFTLKAKGQAISESLT